jgi:hypothetical protein
VIHFNNAKVMKRFQNVGRKTILMRITLTKRIRRSRQLLRRNRRTVLITAYLHIKQNKVSDTQKKMDELPEKQVKEHQKLNEEVAKAQGNGKGDGKI